MILTKTYDIHWKAKDFAVSLPQPNKIYWAYLQLENLHGLECSLNYAYSNPAHFNACRDITNK